MLRLPLALLWAVLALAADRYVQAQQVPPPPLMPYPPGDSMGYPSSPIDYSDLPPADSIPDATEAGWWPSLNFPNAAGWSPLAGLAPQLWDNSIEFGLNGSSGNSESMSLRAGLTAKRRADFDDWLLDISYRKARSRSAEIAHNALFKSRYELLLGESPWSVFLVNTLEYDEFRAFDLRYAANAGLGYRFIDVEELKLAGRFGSGVSTEFGGPDDSWKPEASFGLDSEHKLSERQEVSVGIDYYPAWEDFSDFRMQSQVSWTVLLDEATDMNLKFSIVDRYDSTPNGRKPNDIDYSVVLLWKF